MQNLSRRSFLKSTGVLGATTFLTSHSPTAQASDTAPTAQKIEVLYPRMRVPTSFIIDDSTCLVNMGRFCMPQFSAAWPKRADYQKPWKTWPVEIPDAFVREFGQWSAEHGVKGKYSIVPYPACVGWLDRELPGWSHNALQESLKLVRDLMVPNWDIHPEMISHTRVIDVKTGRPMPDCKPAMMENWYPQTQLSVDQLSAYLAYALQILKNCDLPCEGITTPGGFGGRVKSELSQAVQESVRDVYGAEIPHYFKYIASGNESTQPRIEHLHDADTDHPRLTVSIYGGTGDWYGGWDGDRTPEGDRYCNRDATAGRMVELIDRNEPAIMVCHWAGMYTQGTKQGFAAYQKVVTALNENRADQVIWMKLSEIARYWAAKELTRATVTGNTTTLTAPFACPLFTLRVPGQPDRAPTLVADGKQVALRQVTARKGLESGTWLREKESLVLCFDLPKGESVVKC